MPRQTRRSQKGKRERERERERKGEIQRGMEKTGASQGAKKEGDKRDEGRRRWRTLGSVRSCATAGSASGHPRRSSSSTMIGLASAQTSADISSRIMETETRTLEGMSAANSFARASKLSALLRGFTCRLSRHREC
jgi:hypothetical protein